LNAGYIKPRNIISSTKGATKIIENIRKIFPSILAPGNTELNGMFAVRGPFNTKALKAKQMEI
jgi:RNA binding exosome subunit